MVLTATPRTEVTDRWHRLRTPVGYAAGIGLASLALRLRDPHQHASWGLCPLKALTGFDCPGCGGLRAVNDLTHGHVLDAWHSNALFISLVPVIGLVWVLAMARAWTGSEKRAPAFVVRYTAPAMGIAMVAFMIYRNTPAGAALHVS